MNKTIFSFACSKIFPSSHIFSIEQERLPITTSMKAIKMSPLSLLLVGLISSFGALAQGLPPKIQICTKAAQVAGDIARYRMQSKKYADVQTMVQSAGLPLAQTSRLQGLLDTVWNSVRDEQDAVAKLNPAQIQNDYYLTCSQ